MTKRGNGEGSITRHKKSGLFMARYTVEMPDGTRKRKTIYGKEREEVAEQLIEALSNRNKGLVFDADNLRLGEYLERCLLIPYVTPYVPQPMSGMSSWSASTYAQCWVR